jgi:hypothetical protein
MYNNNNMNATIDIEWIQQEILDQVDAAVENFTMHDPHKLLELSRVIVHSIIDKIDVLHALDYYHHLKDTGQLDNNESSDRIQCLYDYFNDWTELELAKRYA